MAESIDRAPAKPSPAKRRCFQTFKKGTDFNVTEIAFENVVNKAGKCATAAISERNVVQVAVFLLAVQIAVQIAVSISSSFHY